MLRQQAQHGAARSPAGIAPFPDEAALAKRRHPQTPTQSARGKQMHHPWKLPTPKQNKCQSKSMPVAEVMLRTLDVDVCRLPLDERHMP